MDHYRRSLLQQKGDVLAQIVFLDGGFVQIGFGKRCPVTGPYGFYFQGLQKIGGSWDRVTVGVCRFVLGRLGGRKGWLLGPFRDGRSLFLGGHGQGQQKQKNGGGFHPVYF
jgi:hypothetical protein